MQSQLPVLLIEDDLIDVKTVQRAFKQNKIINPLQVAHNGEQALQLLRREGPDTDPTTAPRPGLILLDLNMPVMNGIEFLQAVKSDETLKSIPVVVLTTSKDENDLIETYGFGVAGYIIKPVDFPQFLEVVKAIDLYWSLNERAPCMA
ncbi:MAG TPA: response regulator [Thermoguttaceae bacterium]|nr:response regulator [Thermoguttaceae bacterium]